MTTTTYRISHAPLSPPQLSAARLPGSPLAPVDLRLSDFYPSGSGFSEPAAEAATPGLLAWQWLRARILPGAVERLRRDAALRRPLELGSFARPFESLPERRALLEALDRGASGLEPSSPGPSSPGPSSPGPSSSRPLNPSPAGLTVTLYCLSAAVAEDLEILGRIDRDHALTVRWRIEAESAGGDAYRREAVLAAAAWFSAHGLTTEFHVGAGMPAEELNALARRAAEAGVGDLVAAGGRRDECPDLERLRLIHGFPRAQPVRG
ncbi:MAG: hypothetical protein AAF725_06775 [Acidobacteriota bacterium]